MPPVFRCTISSLHNGSICQNVIHLQELLDPPRPIESVAGTITANWLPWILGAQSHGVQYFEIEVRQVSPLIGVAGQKFPISIFGNGSSELHHQVMAYILKFRTGLIGPRHRGRYYIPACVKGFNTTGVMNSAGNSFFTTASDALTARFCGSTPSTNYQLVIWHKGADPSWTVCTSVIHSNLMGTQARRNVGRGI